MTAGRAAARPSPARWRLWKSEWVSDVLCSGTKLSHVGRVCTVLSVHVGCVFSCCQVSPAAVNSSSAASTGSRPPTCSCASAPTRARRPGRRSWPSSRGCASTSPCRRSSPRRPQPWLLSKRGVCGLTCWCTTVILVTFSRLCSSVKISEPLRHRCLVNYCSRSHIIRNVFCLFFIKQYSASLVLSVNYPELRISWSFTSFACKKHRNLWFVMS